MLIPLTLNRRASPTLGCFAIFGQFRTTNASFHCPIYEPSTTPNYPLFRRAHRYTVSMLAATNSNLVSISEALQAHQQQQQLSNHHTDGASKIVFLDGSWHMPPRSAHSEFQSGPRLPRAFHFDIDDISSKIKNLPHMKPSRQIFARAMDRMGIEPQDVLYVYAVEGCAFAHRAYWTLRTCGHDPTRVKLIQGSFEEWKENGGTLEYGEVEEERLFQNEKWNEQEESPKYKCWIESSDGSADNENYDAGNSFTGVVTMQQVWSVVNSFLTQENREEEPEAVIVDARSEGRFYGTAPEPRPGLRGGHMPGSINIPFLSLLQENDLTKFRPMKEVREIFIKAGIQPLENGREGNQNNDCIENATVRNTKSKIICSCGSGVTAATLAVALEECGLRRREDIYIYDGSWIEWGGDESTPIVKLD